MRFWKRLREGFSDNRSLRQSYEDAASAIETFLDGSGGPWDWDDWVSVREKDPFLESVRQRCSNLPEEFPTEKEGHYCSDAGTQVLKELANDLREKITSLQSEKEP